MGDKDIKQIMVDGYPVGIIGLDEAIEELSDRLKDAPDEEIEKELLERLMKRNYIPQSAKERYGKAFVREFKKALGMSVEEEGAASIDIKVLGPGCPQCDRLEQALMEVVAETGINAGIQHIRDVKEIARYGVMGTPALIINGDVKCVGRVPPKSQLIGWLKDAS